MKELSVQDELAGVGRQRSVMIEAFFRSCRRQGQSISRNVGSCLPLAAFLEKQLGLVLIVSRYSSYRKRERNQGIVGVILVEQSSHRLTE